MFLSRFVVFPTCVLWVTVFSVVLHCTTGQDSSHNIATTRPPAISVNQGKKCKIGMCLHPEMLPGNLQCIFNSCGPDGHGSCCVEPEHPAIVTLPHGGSTPRPTTMIQKPVLADTPTQTPLALAENAKLIPKHQMNGGEFGQAATSINGRRKTEVAKQNESIEGSKVADSSTDGQNQRSSKKWSDHSYKDHLSSSYTNYGAPGYDDHFSYRTEPNIGYSSLSCICTPIPEHASSYEREARSYNKQMQKNDYSTYEPYSHLSYGYTHMPNKPIMSHGSSLNHGYGNEYSAYSSYDSGDYGHLYGYVY